MTPALSQSRVALVTGAGRGIGRKLSLALAEAGLSVGLVGRTQSTLESVAGEIAGPTAWAVADVTRPEQVTRAVDKIEAELGPVDLLVDNAGLSDDRVPAPWESDPDDWWRVLEVNLRGPMLMARALVPRMLERGTPGRILELASGMGIRPVGEFSAYSVSKGALLHWVDNLAAALSPDGGVRVLAASPGFVRTDMTEAMWGDVPDGSYGTAGPLCEVARRFAVGELDALHGWFVHASRDDVDGLLAVAAGADEDTRRLRLRGYGPDDPMTGQR
ncbi:MAG: SDR family NAD(P)-dependent oxidoreductase [Propionibacteriales bacterium]|nr:SDR family NAD(P)-dependent oxidoreductase [Propionibacteriales bacterium]